ncbi:D-alanyl-D-alanine carboxypeptidase [Pinirhizobacter soli]|uniref:D-alanyl-D-alanine carboxypeptidase n=1 Tax=Pinirhizobacter soli TaxID=2786953 RepID=UPI003CCD5B06
MCTQKTGSLTGISSLSGYVDTANGRPLVFSMLTNNFVVPSAKIKELEDRLAVALAECGAQTTCD